MINRLLLILMVFSTAAFSQIPPIEPGVSQELAKWRAAHYSDVRYKLNMTLEKMSPVLKGTIEIRVKVGAGTLLSPSSRSDEKTPIILDWRKIKGHESKSTIANATLNGKPAIFPPRTADGDKSVPAPFEEISEHLIFRDGVVVGENVIKLDFTSPILPSGSAITRYVDKEDGSEYIYSLFVPSDASTAFPVFDQPDLKAKFTLQARYPKEWRIVSNVRGSDPIAADRAAPNFTAFTQSFEETRPISTYVFAFAAGPFVNFREDLKDFILEVEKLPHDEDEQKRIFASMAIPKGQNPSFIYVRRSQLARFKPHAAEVFRLNREAVKYFEQYFDYKFPFPKYDLVLVPEFPFGGMEHAGATFLRESSIIFPQEPTKNDYISRATLIFHETAHQWFGDTVTMRWFDDLWLKEGFATFTAYKALERIMPEMNAWKVFYERVKQGAYQTDSTKGTTPIYQEIKNLSAAKSAYGAIVYNKAPAFLRQAEFYLGEDKFQTAVRSFLKKHEYANAGWEDLVDEFQTASRFDLTLWADTWVKKRGLPKVRWKAELYLHDNVWPIEVRQEDALSEGGRWEILIHFLVVDTGGKRDSVPVLIRDAGKVNVFYETRFIKSEPRLVFPNHGDYGYGIFLLDDKSRDYVLKNIQNEKDPFLRSMMWGALWDSVREGELSPKEYVQLVVTILGSPAYRRPPQDDESTIASLLNRVGTAMTYYLPLPPMVTERPPKSLDGIGTVVGSNELGGAVETMLIGEMQREGSSLGRRLTFYRAFLSIAASQSARSYLKQILAGDTKGRVDEIPLKTKDKFDIVTRLLILNDPDAPKLLADLEKTETSDDAKRYAYAARAGIATAENKAKYWNDFVNNKEISESWIEAAFGPWNSIRHSELTLPYLQKALQELPNHKRNRKIFFVNGWLGAFIGGQRSEEALAIVNKFLADNPNLDKDLRLKILENVDVIERAVRIRGKFRER